MPSSIIIHNKDMSHEEFCQRMHSGVRSLMHEDGLYTGTAPWIENLCIRVNKYNYEFRERLLHLRTLMIIMNCNYMIVYKAKQALPCLERIIVINEHDDKSYIMDPIVLSQDYETALHPPEYDCIRLKKKYINVFSTHKIEPMTPESTRYNFMKYLCPDIYNPRYSTGNISGYKYVTYYGTDLHVCKCEILFLDWTRARQSLTITYGKKPCQFNLPNCRILCIKMPDNTYGDMRFCFKNCPLLLTNKLCGLRIYHGEKITHYHVYSEMEIHFGHIETYNNRMCSTYMLDLCMDIKNK